MTTAKNVMKMIKDNDVKYVDFRFTMSFALGMVFLP